MLPATRPPEVEEMLGRFRICEFSTLAPRDRAPIARPIAALWRPEGRFVLTTSVGLAQKALNVRRDPGCRCCSRSLRQTAS